MCCGFCKPVAKHGPDPHVSSAEAESVPQSSSTMSPIVQALMCKCATASWSHRFPLERSALAPGMCAEVDVCFMPDSLGDYQDAFTVDTPAGRFDVQLTGQRPHPVLTLPPVLEVSLSASMDIA